jgi:nucleoside-diphosphate-sugar epimerase
LNYIVTGGAGFIGSHIAEALLNEGHTVTILDNFSEPCCRVIEPSGDKERLEVIRGILQIFLYSKKRLKVLMVSSMKLRLPPFPGLFRTP